MSTCDSCPKVTAEAADIIITYVLQFLLKENLAIPNNYHAATTDIISSYKPETLPRLIMLISNDDKKKNADDHDKPCSFFKYSTSRHFIYPQ